MFNIIGRRNWYFLFSALIIVPGTVALLAWGLRLGIDFTGGSLLEVRLDREVAPGTVRDVFTAQGLDTSVVTSQDPSGRISYLIRSTELDTPRKNQLVDHLRQNFGGV